MLKPGLNLLAILSVLLKANSLALASESAGADDLLNKAKKAEQDKDYRTAIELYESAVESPEIEERARLGITNAYLSLGKTDKAENYAKSAIEKDPFRASYHVQLAEIFRMKRNFEEAEHELGTVEKLEPGSVSLNQSRGMVRFDQENYDAAIQLFSRALNKDPNAELSRLRRAQAFIKTGRFDSGIKDLLTLIEARPSNVRLHVALAEGYIKLGSFSEAEKTLKIALNLDSRSASVMEMLGDLNVAMGKAREAVTYYKQACDLVPADMGAGTKLGEAYVLSGQSSLAEKEFRRVLHVNEGYIPAAQKIISLWNSQKRYGEIGSFLTHYTAKFPNQDWAVTRYARMLISVSEYAKAEAILKELLKYDENNIDGLLTLASVKLKREDKDEAFEYLRKAEQANPLEGRAKFDIALLQESVGQFDEAIDKYKQIKMSSTVYLKARINLGLLLERRKRFDEALTVFKGLPEGTLEAGAVKAKVAELERKLGSNEVDSSNSASQSPGREISSERQSE